MIAGTDAYARPNDQVRLFVGGEVGGFQTQAIMLPLDLEVAQAAEATCTQKIGGKSAPLRLAIMVDDLFLQTWQRNALCEALAGGDATLVAVIVGWPPIDRMPSWWDNLRSGRLHKSTECYDFYERFADILRGAELTHAKRHDIRELLSGVIILNVEPQRQRRVYESFSEHDLAQLKALNIDVIMRFGFRILKGEILSLPRFGVWSYHHGDENNFRGGPSCFWEMVQGAPAVGCILQVLTEKLDGGRVIYKSYSSCPETFWINAVREQHYLKTSAFLRRCLAIVRETGELPTEPEGCGKSLGRVYRKPGNLRAFWMLSKLASRSALAVTANRFRRPQWSVAVRKTDPVPAAVPQGGPFETLFRKRKWSLADPNLITVDGVTYCMAERYTHANSKGHIVCFRFSEDGRPTEPKLVINGEHHLSYPFAFEWDGAVHLAVESAHEQCIKVFRATSFPLHWTEVARFLENRRAYDPTLLEHEGLWYLFVAIDECGGGANDELFLFSAETPLGPWKPHPGNPVVSDVRAARPAGSLYRNGDKLYRPTQDCSRRYGRAINICEVTELSPTAYSQRIIGRIDSGRAGQLGSHTISRSGGYEVIDRRAYSLSLPFVGP